MSAYTKSLQLNLTGTDAEMVAILQVLTVSDIPVKSVRTWFREQNLWLERSTGGMMGPLQIAYESASQQAKDGLDYLYDTVFAGSADYLRTTSPAWAPQVKALVDLVVALSPQTSGLVDSFYALDGGRPWKDLTVEQYAAQKAEYEATETAAGKRQDWKERFDAALNTIGTSEQSTGVAAIRAIADEMEAV
jgi:hypothetical protein